MICVLHVSACLSSISVSLIDLERKLRTGSRHTSGVGIGFQHNAHDTYIDNACCERNSAHPGGIDTAVQVLHLRGSCVSWELCISTLGFSMPSRGAMHALSISLVKLRPNASFQQSPLTAFQSFHRALIDVQSHSLFTSQVFLNTPGR